MRLAVHFLRMGEMKIKYSILVERPDRKKLF
jgi:hypothetical protein